MSGGLDPALMQALSSPSTYPGRPPVTVVATHGSVVFLAGERAYKVKRPVKLAFLDYSSLARRRDACREELRVNRALAPRIYLAVRAICPARYGGLQLREDGAPDAVEYAVEMLRFQETDTMAGAIAAGRLSREQVREVGTVLAGFHREASVVEDGGPDRLLAAWQRNLQELAGIAGIGRRAAEAGIDPAAAGSRDLLEAGGRGSVETSSEPAVAGSGPSGAEPAILDRARLQEAKRFGETFVAANAHEIAQRGREGHVRDGHGDIRCEHVLLVPEVQIVDRIEFDPALRHGDVASDIAFLTMDLQAHRQGWAAREVVAAYRRAGGSPGSERLRCFHGAHRALVRVKVALLSIDEGCGPASRAARLGEGCSEAAAARGRRTALIEARRLVELSGRLAWCARRPVAIAVCGPAASGKSTLAVRLARLTGLPVIASDVVRKRLAGIAPTERGRAGIYTEQFTHAVYDELSRRALVHVRARGGAIVDATCRTRGQRALIVRRMRQSGCTLLFVHCDVPLEVALARAAARISTERISDATLDVAGEQHRSFQPLGELAPESVLRLDATLPVDDQLRAVTAALDRAARARLSALPRRSGALTR